MKNTVRRAAWLYAFAAVFFIGLGIMLYSFIANGEVWAANRVNGHLYSGRQLTTAGSILDIKGVPLAQTVNGKREYAESANVRRATLHAVGDSQGFIATGVQTIYRSELIGYGFISGIYRTIRSGKGSDITMTIDSTVCEAAYKALGTNKGTVGVYNYKTGEVICMVSTPTYDPENKPKDINTDTSGKYDGIYLNRFISGVYTPGSTFKIITAICAIENIPDIYSRSFTCKGSCTIGAGKVICNSTHGKISFQQALNRSCNCVFSTLAAELGTEKLTQTVRSLGFGKSVALGDVKTIKSSFSLSGASTLDLGWAGIGQYTTLINPCQMMVLLGAIANGGVAIEPTLIKSMSGQLNLNISKTCSNVTLSADTAQQMSKLLRSNVTDYYGKKLDSSLEMAGKTGTAEVSNGKPHAWFAGFSQSAALPYAIVVVVENGGGGSSVAIPIANAIMKAVRNAVS